MQSPITHIAAGSDGTDEGSDAVALAAALADGTGAGLTLVRVFPTTLFPAAGITDRETLREQADEGLRRDRDDLAPEALLHSVADLSVSRAVAHFAERTHAGLVVIGSSPTAPERRTAVGRRGRQLLHDVPFALAVARRGLAAQRVLLRRFAVGDDGGPEAQVAKATAIELCRATGATLVIAAVTDDRYPLVVGAAPGRSNGLPPRPTSRRRRPSSTSPPRCARWLAIRDSSSGDCQTRSTWSWSGRAAGGRSPGRSTAASARRWSPTRPDDHAG